jgi:hypothetical protein
VDVGPSGQRAQTSGWIRRPMNARSFRAARRWHRWLTRYPASEDAGPGSPLCRFPCRRRRGTRSRGASDRGRKQPAASQERRV